SREWHATQTLRDLTNRRAQRMFSLPSVGDQAALPAAFSFDLGAQTSPGRPTSLAMSLVGMPVARRAGTSEDFEDLLGVRHPPIIAHRFPEARVVLRTKCEDRPGHRMQPASTSISPRR